MARAIRAMGFIAAVVAMMGLGCSADGTTPDTGRRDSGPHGDASGLDITSPGDSGNPANPDGAATGCFGRTCTSVGANCGPIADGCGGLIDCGNCSGTDTCGGAGVPSVCGTLPSGCVPQTCAAVGDNCGPVADGCGGLLSCGTCTAPETCGGSGVPSVCGAAMGSGGCTGLCLRRATCSGTTTTTISGTVVAPTPPSVGTPDPLYNAVVYIPNSPVLPFSPGVACERCGAPLSGSPLVSFTTGPDGRFTLTNVPTGANIPLVIQLGRWRRQITIPMVNPCVDNPLTTDQTRLPRNHTEGDIPLMAMVTGAVDSLECVLRKIGIDDSEFTNPSGGGRVQMYVGNGISLAGGSPPMSGLTSNPATIAQYDMVLFACWGMPVDQPSTDQTNVINYANEGGRVFATHYSYVWMYNDPPFSTTAGWTVNQPDPATPLTATVDTSFARGMAFAQWLVNVGASTTLGQVQIADARHDFNSVNPPAQRWLYDSEQPLHYTFNTPVGVADSMQCGRVLFSDFHVSNAGFGFSFPSECGSGPLTPQEKVLEFMIFDLSSCVATSVPTLPMCVPTTCAAAGVGCGPIGDGCGGSIDCGNCSPPDTCGGGGTPSQCGHGACTPRTCADVGATCGPIGDGCGGTADCGTCTPPDTCGGGGTPSQCGTIG